MTDGVNTALKDPEEDRLVITPLKFFLKALGDHPLLSIWLFSGELFNTIILLLVPYAVRDLIDGVHGFDASSGLSIWDVIGNDFRHFVFLSVMLIFTSRFSGMSLFFLSPIIRYKPRMRMFKHLHNHDMGYFQDMMSGSLGSKISESTTGLALALWTFTYEAWPIFILATASAILLAKLHLYLGLALALWFAIYCPIIVLMTIKKAKVSEKLSRVRSFITGRIVDVAANISAVKAFANIEHEDSMLRDDMEHEVKAIYAYQIIRELTAWFHYIMAFILMVGMMYLSVDLFSQQLISVGTLAFVFTLILLIVDQARGLSFALQGFVEHIGQMSDGVRTIMTSHVLKDTKDAQDLNVQSIDINFDKVCFRYPDTDQKPVIDNMFLHIQSGEKIGLIGPSGAGKSTLVNLLLRFYDLQGGQILINGQDISEVTQSSLRKNIAYIPQDTTLFHRTLMENIRYGDLNASDESVIQAAQKAHAHEFIDALPEGYHTMVGERGVKLSGGQRQRIAIARAILKNAPILVLDEATSALDSESEQLIQQSLESLMTEKTVIAIAHRLSTIAHLDRLVVMDMGQIVEQGTHAELLEKGGLYSQLWARQSGGFIGE